MKYAALAILFALPAAAQEAEPPSQMEQGFRQFMDGLQKEMEPALRDLQGLAENTGPLLQRLQDQLGDVVDDLDAYEAPEILPNGDILIRRKEPLPQDAPPEDAVPEDVPTDEGGSIDL